MGKGDKECNHQYIVGYSFRTPNFFSDKVLCDNCGRKIRLVLPWRILYWFVDIVTIIIVSVAINNVRIELFGSNFLPSVLIATLLIIILQQTKRPILKFGKWIEIN